MSKDYDIIIIGSGIIGLSIAEVVKNRLPTKKILIIDKESEQAFHASGRNSGVLHAGFYYTADSLKAAFTVAGNEYWTRYCKEHGLKINTCGKLVLAQNQDELDLLFELERRGLRNGSTVQLITREKAYELEPNCHTYRKALYSPKTASIDPKEICAHLMHSLKSEGIKFLFSTKYLGHKAQMVLTDRGDYGAKHIINAAGLYADKIAYDFGFGEQYTLIPFKGLYLKYTKNKDDIKMNLYPVPNLNNPFLGVHFTITVNKEIKIGPTAIPALWRENYKGWENFSFKELREILYYEGNLFINNHFGFRDLAFEEIKKYQKQYFIKLAQDMAPKIDPNGFTEFTKPGIRAQLLNLSTKKLVQDFVVEGDQFSTHVLNAVSPAFTCAMPFAEHIYNEYLINNCM